MKKFLSTMIKGGKPMLLTLQGVNSDSGKTTRTAAFDGISEFQTDSKVLHPVISELRVVKTEEELKVLRYVAKVSSDAHMQVMRHIKPGMKVIPNKYFINIANRAFDLFIDYGIKT
jgi:Xaa-Pro dipeptidase